MELGRECDPELCGTCGVLERADPSLADSELHQMGCQNCDLQRGLGKKLALGQSQLDDVGYGIYTAESIAQNDFVIEYVGELISNDEGVRREARRGDIFGGESPPSYTFTLLRDEGTLVDAAVYGNLSRYINHAASSKQDRSGRCNLLVLMPRVCYVNGDFRIKFNAKRDIRVGEELLFDYGENFPNLTKKLLDSKTKQKREGARRPGRPSPVDKTQGAARMSATTKKATERKKPVARWSRRSRAADDEDSIITWHLFTSPLNRPTKRKRAGAFPSQLSRPPLPQIS